MVFSLEKGPHIITKRSTRRIMLEFSAVLAALLAYSVCWYYIKAGSDYGTHAIVIALISVLTSVFADALWASPLLFDRKTPELSARIGNWGLKTVNSYGFVSGLIFALLLPVGTRYYVVAVSAFIGTFFAKSVFGGFGMNFLNPAISARVVAQVSFPSALKTYLGTSAPSTIMTGASVTTVTSNLGWTTNFSGISLFDMFFGNYRGTLGETFAFLIILAGIYLSVRKIIDWRTPAAYLLTLFLTMLVIGFASGLGAHAFEFGLRNLFLGGALFGAVFCLTDPVTGPTSRAGKIIAAGIAALLTALIRYSASSVEGVAYSILLVNILTPIIGRLIKDKSNQHLWVKRGVIVGIMALSMIFGMFFGFANKTSDRYSASVGRYDSDVTFYDLVMDTADSSAGSYEIASADPSYFTDETGSCLKKIDFEMDDASASYYELKTAPDLSYNYNTKQTEGYVRFGLIVNAKGAVGYTYLDGTENSLGLSFAEQIRLSQQHPFTSGSLSSDQVVVPSGASSALNSVYTVPAITAAMEAAEQDFGLTVTSIVTNLNRILSAQSIPTVKVSDVTEESIPTLASGTVNVKLSGFTVGSKDAVYYDVTTDPVTTGDGSGGTLEVGLVITSDGIIGLNLIKAVRETSGANMVNGLASKVSVTSPYAESDLIASGATYSYDSLTACLAAVEADFANIDLSTLNSILTAQSLTNASVSDITVEANPTLTSGTVNVKLSGFTVDSKDAVYYDVTTDPVTTEEGSNGTLEIGVVVTSSGIVGLKLIKAVRETYGANMVKGLASKVSVSSPYAESDLVPAGATHSYDSLTACLAAVLTDFGGAD